MAKTEAQKRAESKYKMKNYALLSYNARKEEAEKFRAFCAEQNTTPNAALGAFVAACLAGSVDPAIMDAARAKTANGPTKKSEQNK